LPTDGAGAGRAQHFSTSFAPSCGISPAGKVAEDITLTNLSFTKYLMWKIWPIDWMRCNRMRWFGACGRARRCGVERRHSILSIEDTQAESSPQGDLVCPLEAEFVAGPCRCVRRSGRSFVMIGPPGTAKKPDHRNIIANTLAQGRTVLFVAESGRFGSRAAAVHAVGLADFCLDCFR